MTETTLPQGRYTIAAYNDGQITVPDVPGVPAPVRAAADKAAKAYAARTAANAEQRACREQLRAAPQIDRANDSAAISAGKPLPDDRLEPVAREAFVVATRRAEACDQSATDLTLKLAATIRDARPGWLPESEASVESTREACLATLDRLARAARRARPGDSDPRCPRGLPARRLTSWCAVSAGAGSRRSDGGAPGAHRRGRGGPESARSVRHHARPRPAARARRRRRVGHRR